MKRLPLLTVLFSISATALALVKEFVLSDWIMRGFV